MFLHPSLSEGTDTNHRHHHNVAKRGQYGDPQPDGVTGHLPIILCFRGPGVAGVEVGGGRLQGRVAVVWRIHEGSTDGREVLREREGRERKSGQRSEEGVCCRATSKTREEEEIS